MNESNMTFEEEITDVINKHSVENKSNTPDFILAEYLLGCLRTYELAINRRDNWEEEDTE